VVEVLQEVVAASSAASRVTSPASAQAEVTSAAAALVAAGPATTATRKATWLATARRNSSARKVEALRAIAADKLATSHVNVPKVEPHEVVVGVVPAAAGVPGVRVPATSATRKATCPASAPIRDTNRQNTTAWIMPR